MNRLWEKPDRCINAQTAPNHPGQSMVLREKDEFTQGQAAQREAAVTETSPGDGKSGMINQKSTAGTKKQRGGKTI